jgi:hypothetical protein
MCVYIYACMCVCVCVYVCVCVCVCVCRIPNSSQRRLGPMSVLYVCVRARARVRVRSVSTPLTELNTRYKQRIRQLSAGGQKHTAN